MRADQITQSLPTVSLDDELSSALRASTCSELPGVVLIDADDAPCGVLQLCDLLAGTVPGFVRESPHLAHVYDETLADRTVRAMTARPLREMQADARVPVVERDATVMEMAAAMALARTSLVAVRLTDRNWGVVTASRLLASLLPP